MHLSRNVDHGLRGPASTGDARFVERAARRLGLECVVERGAVQSLARERGWSVEMAARELRHEFLARTAKRLGLESVAFLGRGGGKAKGRATCDLIMPGASGAAAQEAHLFLIHHFCARIDAAFD